MVADLPDSVVNQEIDHQNQEVVERLNEERHEHEEQEVEQHHDEHDRERAHVQVEQVSIGVVL